MATTNGSTANLNSGAGTGEDAEESFAAARHVAAFFERFERDPYECQELLSQAGTHWLLSNDDHRTSAGSSAAVSQTPAGMVSQLKATMHDNRLVLLMPADDSDPVTGMLDMREVSHTPRATDTKF